MRSPRRAPGGQQRVAREARVNAPLFGGLQSEAQVSVRATHLGWDTEPGPGLRAGGDLMRENPERATSACCRPGSGVTTSAFSLKFSFCMLATWSTCGHPGTQLHRCTVTQPADSLLEGTVTLKANQFIQGRRRQLLEIRKLLRVPPRVCRFLTEMAPVLLHLMWYMTWPSPPLSCDFCGGSDCQ